MEPRWKCDAHIHLFNQQEKQKQLSSSNYGVFVESLNLPRTLITTRQETMSSSSLNKCLGGPPWSKIGQIQQKE